jgi:hypothetical protein
MYAFTQKSCNSVNSDATDGVNRSWEWVVVPDRQNQDFDEHKPGPVPDGRDLVTNWWVPQYSEYGKNIVE